MRVRKLTSTGGDFSFGNGQMDYLINSPEAVAQVVQTTLLLWVGEYFLDITAGTPYPEQILGTHSKDEADAALVAVITGVPGVVSITNYQSTLDPTTRGYTSVSGILNTIYGQTQLELANVQNF